MIPVQLGHGLCAYAFRPSAAASKVYNIIIIYIYIYNVRPLKPFPIAPKLDTHIRRDGLLQLIYIIISYYTFDQITNTYEGISL